uniref:vacuolar fusion protein CCZ1 homolog isoform X1 n=1 Tax=Myxine glutinosa TaxID=7769 RepID=UPI00358DE924
MDVPSAHSLVAFAVYNPRFGSKEGEEHKKLLYYYPEDIEINEKIRTIGLCEAIVQFSRTFSRQSPAHALHTQKNRYHFDEAEEHFWMVMVVKNPVVMKENSEGKSVPEYQEDVLLDSVYSAVLRQTYTMFKLFKGTFGMAMEQGGVETLMRRLQEFFSRYLLTLRLQQCDLIDTLGGISFFPLDKMTYLKIQSFISMVEFSFAHIQFTAFLYNEQLVWSGLEQDDMRTLFKYLTTSLFPSTIEAELAGKESPIHSSFPGHSQHYGRFLLGPRSLTDPNSPLRVPKIHVYIGKRHSELHLIVYKALSAAVCFLVDATVVLTLDFFQRLDALVGPQLTLLASDIAEQYSSNRKPAYSEKDVQFKFIYFNHMNLAEKSTVHVRRAANPSLVTVPTELLHILGDINSDFASSVEDEEVTVKAMSDYWVVGKRSDQRELYVILNQKNANLIEVNGTQLCCKEWEEVFEMLRGKPCCLCTFCFPNDALSLIFDGIS